MIKVAFRFADCAALNFHTAAMLAKQHGFDGVELEAAADPAKTREIFAGSLIEISALNLGEKATGFTQQIEVASELACRHIRIKSNSFFSRDGTITPKATDLLMKAGDRAAAVDVCILIENQPAVGSAIRLWRLLDRLNHPAIGCAWDTVAAVQAGDAPTVAVPTLNSRIHYLQSPADDATVLLRKTMNRLRGIGFAGYLLVKCPGPPSQSIGELEQSLIQAKSTLQQWQILPMAVS